MKLNLRYDEVLNRMAETSLKVFDWVTFRENLKEHRKSYDVLKNLYLSSTLAKMCWIQERQKQRFTDTFINEFEFVSKCKKKTGVDDFVVAYSEGSFGLTMKGMDGGGSAHRHLMIRLSKRVPMVLTDEFRIAKACPVCKNYDLNYEMFER